MDKIERKNQRIATNARAWIYVLTVIYLAAVCGNALSLPVAFWLRMFKGVDVPYDFLAAWAIGTAGLGAGSLLFRVPVSQAFEGIY